MVQIDDLRKKFSARLKEALAARDIPAWGAGARLAKIADVTPKAASKWLNGESMPGGVKMLLIASELGVRVEWLEYGTGGMLNDADTPASNPVPGPPNIAPVAQPNLMYRYPVISWVAAGAWAEAVEPFPPGFADRYELSEYEAKGPAFWLEVKGDSMTSPVGQSITEGTLILVDTEADAFHGKLVIAKLSDSNEATFKKLVEDGGRKYLRPLNPAYPTEMCAEGCRIVGVVVRALMKL